MALGESTASVIYLSVINGKVSRRYKTKEQGCVERTNKEGRVVYEKLYPNVEGRIVDIKKRESEYGIDWQVFIQDDLFNEKYCLSFPYSSRYASSFMSCIKNVNFARPVKLTPWMKEIDGVKKSNLYVDQDGQKVNYYFTKEDPKGLPPMVKKKVKGKDVWDDSERLEFFENMVNNEIIPAIKKSAFDSDTAPSGSYSSKMASNNNNPVDDDDLPF